MSVRLSACFISADRFSGQVNELIFKSLRLHVRLSVCFCSLQVNQFFFKNNSQTIDYNVLYKEVYF